MPAVVMYPEPGAAELRHRCDVHVNGVLEQLKALDGRVFAAQPAGRRRRERMAVPRRSELHLSRRGGAAARGPPAVRQRLD
jgi:hypothetical protein